MSKQNDFAELIGSRICHDLISPIGAINNGLELSQPTKSQEMELIAESVTNASARIRFFRIAFGAAGQQMVGRPEVISILKDTYISSRLLVTWGPLDGQPRPLVRLAFLGLLCLETAMPYGGRVEIAVQGDRIDLTGHADKFNMDPTLWSLLDGHSDPHKLRPAQVQFGLLPVIAADEGRKLSVDLRETTPHITL